MTAAGDGACSMTGAVAILQMMTEGTAIGAIVVICVTML
jgi:hypothetical protein